MKTPSIAQPVREGDEINAVTTPAFEPEKAPEAPATVVEPAAPESPAPAAPVENVQTAEENQQDDDEEVIEMDAAKRIPSNWSVKPIGAGDNIVAICFLDGSTFEGSISDFNKLLKG